MSETPLTDEEERLIYSDSNYGMGDDYAERVVDSYFARKLEKDRANLLEALECILGSAEYEAKNIAREAIEELVNPKNA